jgi:acetyltransferase-like isoleucine patch superfamily enzyme
MIRTIFDDFLARLEEKLADPRLDKNDIVRDALYELSLAQAPNFQKLADYRFPVAARTLLACFDPRNVTLEAEYDEMIDRDPFAARKPLVWLWQMVDRSPLGLNAYLGFKLRRLLAPYIFNRVGENFTCHHGVQWSFAYNISIGKNVTIHRNVFLDDHGEIEIGNHVLIEQSAAIFSCRSAQAGDSKIVKTIIEDGARIGARATVLTGARIARGAVVVPATVIAPNSEFVG